MRKKDTAKTPEKHTIHLFKQKHLQCKTIEDDFYAIGCILAAAAAIMAAISFLCPGLKPGFMKLPPCLFHLISGYYCPGCGGTRAVRALFNGHIIQSAYFHPAVPYGAAIYLYFMVTQTIERASKGRIRIGMRYRNCFAWIAVILIIGNFILKNTLHAFYGFTFGFVI